MTRRDAISALKQQASALKALGATELYLFGSTACADALLESDLDLFIHYDRGSRFSLIELVAVKQLLEHRLGIPVDVTTRDSLDPLLKDRIEASTERVFYGAARSARSSRNSRGDRSHRDGDARENA